MAKATKSSDGRGQVAAHLVDFFCGEQKKRNYKIQSEAAIPELKVFKFSDQALVTQENSWEIYA